MTSIGSRKLTARQLEGKLDLALNEIKSVKSQCEKLLLEREENEIEFIKILDQNKNLKGELSKFHTQLLEVSNHRDTLLETICIFDQDREVYENALQRINTLESDLRDAHKQLLCFEQANETIRSTQRLSLFDELVSNTPHMVYLASPEKSHSTRTVDLTGASSSVEKISFGSKNKFKKYIRINTH